MPCQQITNTGISHSPPLSSRSGPFATEAECLEACKEGACCNGTTCSVKPQCQCNAAAGEVFKGVGTVCSPNPCCRDSSGVLCTSLSNGGWPNSLSVTISGTGSVTMNRTFQLTWNESRQIYENTTDLSGDVVRQGVADCSYPAFPFGCTAPEPTPSLRARVTLNKNLALNFSFQDYFYLSPGVPNPIGCGCGTFVGSAQFPSFSVPCWACGDSQFVPIASIANMLMTQGEVTQTTPIATLARAANPLP